MSKNTLATELESLIPTGVESVAIDRFADAWIEYFSDASAGAFPYVDSPPAKSAMKAAMGGMSVTGALAIQSGISAFWGVLSAGAATYFPGTIAATPPPAISGLAAALAVPFAANVVGGLSLAASCAAIADAIHTANLGGTATVVGPATVSIL